MKLSIVTPTYNSERFLKDCIDSVLNQSLSKHLDIEYIIIDGLSTDKTIGIAKSYPQIKVTSESDKGQSDALNKGFLLAKGDWVLWLNSDDYILPGTLQAFSKAVTKNPSANVVYGHMLFVNESKKIIKKIYNIPYSFNFLRFGLYMPPSSGTFYKTSLLKDNPLSLKHHYSMDTDFFFRCKDIINSEVLPQFTTGFRFWEENKTAHLLSETALPEQHRKERAYNDANYVYNDWQSESESSKKLKYNFYQLVNKPIYYIQKLKSKYFTNSKAS